ncbi:MAG: hypothetical protein ACPGRX_09535, partial [Bdellovibrionales bacterium]
MSTVSYEFLKDEIAPFISGCADSYLSSALYYLLTGRRGLKLYKNDTSALIVCTHPHVEDCLLVFPEIGKGDYQLTASVLGMLRHAPETVQLARYTQGNLQALRQRLSSPGYISDIALNVTEETLMDWRFPMRILDTAVVSDMSGHRFIKIRNKVKRASQSVTFQSIEPQNGLPMMRSALKFWEGTMIARGLETDDISKFYETLFRVYASAPHCISGLAFFEGKRPVGLSLWDRTRPDTGNLLVNLADTSITGLSDFQLVNTCKVLRDNGIAFLNTGGSEIETLDSFKSKYQPAQSV